MILIIMRNFNWSSSVINLTPGGMVPTAHTVSYCFSKNIKANIAVTQNNKT